jgi:hypothetical protein
MRITRLRLLVVSIVIAMVVAIGIYMWINLSSSPQMGPRLSQENLDQVIDIRSIRLVFSEDGRPLGIIEISNGAGENASVMDMC